jgi:hypothetical protein
MPTYEVKVIGQVISSFRIEDADNEIDARDIAENEFLDNYAVTIADEATAWDIVETLECEEEI